MSEEHINKLKMTTLGAAICVALGSMGIADASAFQLWEQDASGLGEAHAGGAAKATNASTEWYNPAGMVRIKQAQISTGLTVANTSIPYKGTIAVNTAQDSNPQAVKVQGGGLNVVPNFHYVIPLSGGGAFGFGINVPFGLQTDYGDKTPLRYAGTFTTIQAVDVTPSIAFPVNKDLSFGFGLDLAQVNGEFDQYTTLGTDTDTKSTNTGTGLATGFHAGLLWQLSPDTRFGIAYHSALQVNLSGTSKFSGSLANIGAGGTQKNHDLYTDFTLPASTMLSAFHQFNSSFSAMASATYTNWDVFDKLVLNNVITPFTDKAQVTVPEHYKATWNLALGTDFQVNQNMTLQLGAEYDMSPTNNKDRNIQLPDSNRVSASVGATYQWSKSLKMGVGYMHIFPQTAKINNVQPLPASVIVTTEGNVKSSADIVGTQLIWNI